MLGACGGGAAAGGLSLALLLNVGICLRSSEGLLTDSPVFIDLVRGMLFSCSVRFRSRLSDVVLHSLAFDVVTAGALDSLADILFGAPLSCVLFMETVGVLSEAKHREQTNPSF